jgi:hypothetical protein
MPTLTTGITILPHISLLTTIFNRYCHLTSNPDKQNLIIYMHQSKLLKKQPHKKLENDKKKERKRSTTKVQREKQCAANVLSCCSKLLGRSGYMTRET